jgi:hypothetical protein
MTESSLGKKLHYTRWELAQFEEAHSYNVRRLALNFAACYIQQMIEMLDEQQKNEIDAILNDLPGELK